jgi:uncharacterized protein
VAGGTRRNLKPVHLTLHLTTACNMQCDYCYAPPHDGAGMSLGVARQAMELGTRMNGGASCGVVLFGGEPLLQRPLIYQLVKQARELERSRAGRFHFKVTTNGLLLDEEFLDFSIRENLLVAMSFDGTAVAQNAHRRLRSGEPSYELLLPKLRLLLMARPYSSILMVVNPDTARHLIDSVSLLLDEGARYLLISLNYDSPRHLSI